MTLNVHSAVIRFAEVRFEGCWMGECMRSLSLKWHIHSLNAKMVMQKKRWVNGGAEQMMMAMIEYNLHVFDRHLK